MSKKLMPKDCTSCERTKFCKSHFGGLGCAYNKEIAEVGKGKYEKKD